jgi:hypothetical protein
MPAFIAMFMGAFLNIAASLVGRVLLSLGIGVAVYTGLSSSLTFLKTNAVQAFGALPAQVLGMMATMKVGESISIVSSAILVRLLVNGLNSDTVKRWTTK